MLHSNYGCSIALGLERYEAGVDAERPDDIRIEDLLGSVFAFSEAQTLQAVLGHPFVDTLYFSARSYFALAQLYEQRGNRALAQEYLLQAAILVEEANDYSSPDLGEQVDALRREVYTLRQEQLRGAEQRLEARVN